MINNFDKEYAFLSNFYPSPISDADNTITFPTVEHYFQAAKTLNDVEVREIAAAPTPGLSKRLGRHCTLRPDWEDIKIDVMRDALRLKFANPELKTKLLATGEEELCEGTWWHDRFWGVCYCEKCKGQGENHLGQLLMEIRSELKEN